MIRAVVEWLVKVFCGSRTVAAEKPKSPDGWMTGSGGVGPQSGLDGNGRAVVRRVMEPARRGGHRGVTVRPNRHPYWVLRGWRKVGRKLVGAYRTRRGSLAGEIEFDGCGRPVFYIINPPPAVRKGPHGPCFRRRGPRFWIHLNRGQTVDGGIIAIEAIIANALGC